MIGKISTGLRYMIDIIGMDPLSFGVARGGGNSEKLEKMRYF